MPMADHSNTTRGQFFATAAVAAIPIVSFASNGVDPIFAAIEAE